MIICDICKIDVTGREYYYDIFCTRNDDFKHRKRLHLCADCFEKMKAFALVVNAEANEK